MAAYLGEGTKENSSQCANELLQATNSNTACKTVERPEEQTSQESSAHVAVRNRLLKNPTVLDTLDSVHRSLLFNNLKFKPDEPSGNAEKSLEPVATRTILAHIGDQRHGKVNIPAALARSAEVSDGERHRSGSNDVITVAEDWNNIIQGGGSVRSSRVKMMVQQYEAVDGNCRNAVTSSRGLKSNIINHRGPSSEPLDHIVSACDVETSDFESASVTSGSSAADGGCRSVRTSSAFSEGSRDVASIDRFDLGAPEVQGTATSLQQDEHHGGHNTMITININYRCDTNPLRTSPKPKSEDGDATEKTVDIVVSAPAQAVELRGDRKSSPSSDKFTKDETIHFKKRTVEQHTKTEDCELIDRAQDQHAFYDERCENVDHDDRFARRKSSINYQNKTDCLVGHGRSSTATNRSCQTPENEEYHDCSELHDSTLSFYEQASSQPATPLDAEKKRRSRDKNSSTSSSADSNAAVSDVGEQPMIRIVQELTEDQREVTSTITLNKAQIEAMQKLKGSKGLAEEDPQFENPEKRRKSHGSSGSSSSKKRNDKSNLHRQQRIIDDNFCNEILDSTIHFDRLYGINRDQDDAGLRKGLQSPSPTGALADECFSDSVVCDIASPGEESFDSRMSVGKLEGKPRYSGKTIGRLMMKRLKKLQHPAIKGGSASSGHKTDASDGSSSSSILLHTSGPKKPPRTFANSPKRLVLCDRQNAPSCPTRKEMEDSDPSDIGIGWKLDTKPKPHQLGWSVPVAVKAKEKNQSIPAQVYSMLHYSEDESCKRLIRTGNSKPAPQQSSMGNCKHVKQHWNEPRERRDPLGPKLDIDTVDGVRTPSPRRHSSSTDFDRFVKESNAKSTPHRRGELQNGSRQGGTGSTATRRLIEQFLNEERQAHPAHRKLPAIPTGERRRRTTGGIFERRRQQQENFLEDARRTNHEPRRRKAKAAQASKKPPTAAGECSPIGARKTDSLTRNGNVHNGASVSGKVAKRRTFRKAALLKRTRTLFEASKKKIWAMKKFETPKKLNSVSSTVTPSRVGFVHDPNINRKSSVKKKQNLHHKHLGFTPEHLRCKSCHPGLHHPVTADGDIDEAEDEEEEENEEIIVPLSQRPLKQAAPLAARPRTSFLADENKENDCGRRRTPGSTNRKSVRSLNFPPAPRQQLSPLELSEEEEVKMSPRKSGKQLINESKFFKTLRNLKISPKRMFRFGSQSSTASTEQCPMADRVSHGQGEFHSFDDLNLDNVAHMGDLLSNIRRIVDGRGEPETQQRPFRPVHVAEDEEPIYQEISPKGNKTILNEFISTETNKRYLMVNNNPNILYATVNKAKGARVRPCPLVRARSLTNVVSAGPADPIVTSTPVNKPQNNTSKSQMKPANRRAAALSPKGYSGDDNYDCVDVVLKKEQDCSIYNTALAESSCHCPTSHYSVRQRVVSDGVGGGSGGGGRRGSTNAAATSASSTRRSLFSHVSSTRSSGERSQQKQQSTDESDFSVLQGEERETSLHVAEPLIVRERVEDRLEAGVVVRREYERFQQKPAPYVDVKENERGFQWQIDQDKGMDRFSFEQDIIVEVKKVVGINRKDTGRVCTSLPKQTKNAGVAPLGCFDTDSEIESLRRYQDKEIEELVISLQDNATLSDMGSLETGTTASSVANDFDRIGYDTVDLALPVHHAFQCRPVEKHNQCNLTVNTVDVSELISHPENDDTFATCNVSPITGSPSNGGRMLPSSGSTTVMRNLKDKLRASFRKSKTFIKSERQRFASYLLEDRQESKPSASSASSSGSSSSSNSPRKRAGQQSASFAAINSDQDSDELYRSLVGGSSGIISTGSMTELSSQYMSDLILQIKRQADARKQLKQALAICRSTREFECSPELIEAERLLLMATLQETAARNVLSQIDYVANGMTLAKSKHVGMVVLKHFEFPLTETAVSDALFNYFYVVICTYKDQVKGTLATERHNDGRVYFRECEIRFENLDADYEIRVEVFGLRLRKNMKNYSFESRYHLEKDSPKRTVGCPSPSKKLRDAGRMFSFRSNSPKTFDFDNEFSRFKSQGFLTLTSFALLTANGGESLGNGKTFDTTYATAPDPDTNVNLDAPATDEPSAHSPYYSVSSNFQQTVRRQGNENVFLVEDFKYLTLDSMAYNSNMTGSIGMGLNSEIRFEGSNVSGFLDVGEKKSESGNGISWNRRWCKMNGFVLEFWNYPQECQEKQPVQYIDLVKCVNERIELAERSICSRPRTLKVDIFSSQNAATVISCNSSGIGSYKSTGATTSPHSIGEASVDQLRTVSPDPQCNRNNVTCFLLAAETQTELKRWLKELNRAVKFLKEWKI